jgi:hypothetical protein
MSCSAGKCYLKLNTPCTGFRTCVSGNSLHSMSPIATSCWGMLHEQDRASTNLHQTYPEIQASSHLGSTPSYLDVVIRSVPILIPHSSCSLLKLRSKDATPCRCKTLLAVNVIPPHPLLRHWKDQIHYSFPERGYSHIPVLFFQSTASKKSICVSMLTKTSLPLPRSFNVR